MSNNFRYQSFVTVSRNLGEKVPVVDDMLSCHEQEMYLTTSLDENCIKFEFRTAWNYCVDSRRRFFSLTLKFVKVHGYEIDNIEEGKKEHQQEPQADDDTGHEEKAPVPLITHVSKILHSTFSNVEV